MLQLVCEFSKHVIDGLLDRITGHLSEFGYPIQYLGADLHRLFRHANLETHRLLGRLVLTLRIILLVTSLQCRLLVRQLYQDRWSSLRLV